MISLESFFVGLLGLQLLVIASHDWITVPGWNDARQVQAVIGRKKLAWATVINTAFPTTAFVAALWYFHQPKPGVVRHYWLLYTSITVVSAIVMWWIPYFFGSSAASEELYRRMYAGTRHVLPPRKGNPGPNATHLAFHLLFVASLICAAVIWLKHR